METWFISKPTSIENYTPQTLKTFTIHLTVKLFENKKIIKSCLKSYKLSMQQPQKQKSNIRFNIQKQPSRGVLRKGVLKICNKFTGEYPCESAILCVFFYKVAAYFQNTFCWQQLYRAASNYRTFQPSSYHWSPSTALENIRRYRMRIVAWNGSKTKPNSEILTLT